MSNMLSRAHDFVIERHKNHKRKFTGCDYVIHLEETAQLLWEAEPDSSIDDFIAALLHDVVEDTSTTLEEVGQHFGGYVMNLINELTNDENEIEKMGKLAYMIKKVNMMTDKALTINLCDRFSNVRGLLDERTPDAFVESYWKETTNIIMSLDRDLNKAQTYLIDRISSILNYLKLTRNI